MKTLDFNFQLLQLNGREAGHAGECLGNCLVSQSRGEALKFYDWAVRLSKKEPLIVDQTDCKKIREFIEGTDSMTILAKGQLLHYMDSVKDE